MFIKLVATHRDDGQSDRSEAKHRR